MSKYDFVARFVQPPDVIFALLTDTDRHHRIMPYCKSVAVTDSRTLADGRPEITMRHHFVIERVSIATDVHSVLRYDTQPRSLEMVSQFGGGNLKSTGRVSGEGTGSVFISNLDISGLPLRYRLLLVEPLLRRAHTRLTEKISRRAAENAGTPNGV
jgi:carbon monoxide dehydrogenase subunit G